MSVQPLYAIARINICAHLKNLKHWQPYHCSDTQKSCTHWQVGTGSTALAAAVPYPGKERVALLLQLLCLTLVRRPKFPVSSNEAPTRKLNKKNPWDSCSPLLRFFFFSQTFPCPYPCKYAPPPPHSHSTTWTIPLFHPIFRLSHKK